MKLKQPYFMKNEKWYYFDEEGKCQLTDQAPPKAHKSYENFYATIDAHHNRNHNIIRDYMFEKMKELNNKK